MSTDQNRVRPGVPTGGQYAATVRAEAGLALTPPAPAADLFFDADGTEWDWDEREPGVLDSSYVKGLGMRLHPEHDGATRYEVIDQHTGKVHAQGTAESTDEAKAEAKAHRDKLAKYAGSGPLKVGARTPWGSAHSVANIAPGIDVVHTAGHGGIKLSAARNREVDEAWRSAGGFFEEDCRWSVAVISHPDAFTEDHVKDAHTAARRWLPEQYMQVVGADPAKYGVTDYRPIQPGESEIWDEKVFFRANHEDVETVLAAASTERAGFIRVTVAAVDADGKTQPERRRTVLMSSEEYGKMQRVGDRMVIPKGFQPAAD